MGFVSPESVEEAVAALAGGRARALAGGTDLWTATDRPALAGDLVDLSRVAALRGIEDRDGEVRIGAATPWAEIARPGALPPACDGLRAAAREVGGAQIQARGTLGGNLCNASPAADGVPPLLTLGAEVELASAGGGLRRLPLGAFLRGARATALAPGELMTAVILPEVAGRGGFAKLGARRHLVISIVMAAVRVVVRGGRIAEARVAVGACSAVAMRLGGVEAALLGVPVGEALAAVPEGAGDALSPIDDVRAEAGYRREVAAEMIRRALAAALEGGA